MDVYEKAKKIAAAYIGARMYTCHEIEERLLRKNIEKSVAQKVVSDFIEAGILNDREYAKAYAEEGVKLKCKGPYRIKQELYLKGVAQGIIDEALKEFEDDPYEALKEFTEMHKLLSENMTRKEADRVKARLARRGYSMNDINKCFDEFGVKIIYE